MKGKEEGVRGKPWEGSIGGPTGLWGKKDPSKK